MPLPLESGHEQNLVADSLGPMQIDRPRESDFRWEDCMEGICRGEEHRLLRSWTLRISKWFGVFWKNL